MLGKTHSAQTAPVWIPSSLSAPGALSIHTAQQGQSRFDLLLICLSCFCPFGSTVDSLSHKNNLSPLTPGRQECDGWTFFLLYFSSLFHIAASGLHRIAELVCTLINSLLKCFDSLLSWFLGIPSTKEALRSYSLSSSSWLA